MNSRAGIALLIATLLTGCSDKVNDAPPQVRYGQDECAHCGMIVSDERYAAALRVRDGAQQRDLVFDDIGDMLDYEREHNSIQIQHRYVHDFETRQWIDAARAAYLKSDDFHTPMGSGIVALANQQAAQNRSAAASGQIRTLEQLTASIRSTH